MSCWFIYRMARRWKLHRLLKSLNDLPKPSDLAPHVIKFLFKICHLIPLLLQRQQLRFQHIYACCTVTVEGSRCCARGRGICGHRCCAPEPCMCCVQPRWSVRSHQHIKIHRTKDLLCWQDTAGFALGDLEVRPGVVPVEARCLHDCQGVGARDATLRPVAAKVLHPDLLQ